MIKTTFILVKISPQLDAQLSCSIYISVLQQSHKKKAIKILTTLDILPHISRSPRTTYLRCMLVGNVEEVMGG